MRASCLGPLERRMRPRARLGDERKLNDWEFDELNGSSDKFLVEISPVFVKVTALVRYV